MRPAAAGRAMDDCSMRSRRLAQADHRQDAGPAEDALRAVDSRCGGPTHLAAIWHSHGGTHDGVVPGALGLHAQGPGTGHTGRQQVSWPVCDLHRDPQGADALANLRWDAQCANPARKGSARASERSRPATPREGCSDPKTGSITPNIARSITAIRDTTATTTRPVTFTGEATRTPLLDLAQGAASDGGAERIDIQAAFDQETLLSGC